jgi:putative molybdopterin biosynthesis protein
MSVYLHDIPLNQALNIFQKALKKANYGSVLEPEFIPVDENGLNRVLAEPVWAKISSPHYHASAMDGFAIRSADLFGASETNPVTVPYGHTCAYLDTGDPLPDWADAVIPIENVEPVHEDVGTPWDVRHPEAILVRASIPPWRNVRPLGEDIVATQLVLPTGHLIRPVDLGVIAACGHDKIAVVRQPRVAIIPTGSELLPIGKAVKIGEIIEFNSLVLATQVNSWLGKATRFEIVVDDFELICQAVKAASIENDLILLNAGSSAGSEDFSATVVESLGELLVHGVAVRPGHPVVLGMIDRPKSKIETLHGQVPIIGVPGYPVSAAMTGEIFVKPILERWLGRQHMVPSQKKAILTHKITSPAGDDDYVRVVLGRVGKRTLASPLSRGAGVITSLSQADGLVVIPRGSQGISAGEEVKVQLLLKSDDTRKTIFAIGSHDMIMDIIAQMLSKYGRRLVSSNVGSLGGLIAIKKGEAHLAGSHLLDPGSGEYNISYIKNYLHDTPVVVVTLVHRQQGLMVKKDNPKNIHSLQDLTRSEITFINRQKGAGTRVLLDYQLELAQIDKRNIKGYEREEYTHLAIAAAITSGRADCGMGIAAAATALELDFIPLFKERYDLVFPQEYYSSRLMAPMIRIINGKILRQTISKLNGYDASEMGAVVAYIG